MRVKRGTVSKRKHKKLLSETKGFRGTKSKLVKTAREAALHKGAYAYHGRKLRKRDMRRLWITRIREAVRAEGMTYHGFINALKKANIALDRKMLSEILLTDRETFKKIVDSVKNI